ncbi:hypothetical protein Syun_009636 [Stephania yunnanensis]|uniref:Cyanobacterial aminoacyl-tRNA synthetase CAAD domain-containing protein n=1 Tax=Stephania yunnanensis TaxID=152371 RepID=A0AAP0PP79_9MAGN
MHHSPVPPLSPPLWPPRGAASRRRCASSLQAIDRLPIVPGVLELVGIGYSGWFAYNDLVFKPDREALIQKIKDT